VTGTIPAEQCAIIGANIRALRQRRGWTQARLRELMGWPTTSTVWAAEGCRNDRQRGFTNGEVEQLTAIFGVSPWQLTTQCANCQGQPPAGVRLPGLRSHTPQRPAGHVRPHPPGAARSCDGEPARAVFDKSHNHQARSARRLVIEAVYQL